MLKLLLGFFLLLFLSPSRTRLDQNLRSYWIVWNVGQGQWSTLVSEYSCHHFDMGGERNPLRRVSRLCRGKRNFILLSHWDWDHIGFLLKARGKLSRACIEVSPLGTSSPRKMKMIAAYARCATADQTPARELTHFLKADLTKKTNELSHVFLVQNQILIPGDSTIRQEENWSRAAELEHVRIILLGHHGSRTSTSPTLLTKLRGLKMAVASARLEKYGHPHAEVVQRLSNFRVPLLKTQDWGNIWFEAKLSSCPTAGCSASSLSN